MKRLAYVLFVGVLLLSVGSGSAFAQATASAAVQGTITDQSDAAIKGTKVAITSKEQGWTRSTDTSDTGFYRFELLPAGIYSIKVNASGFSTAEAMDVVLQVGATTTQNFTLKPGSVSEIIEVTSAVPLVDQQKMDVSTNITPQQIQELPLIGRDIADLAYLSPGVKSADSYDPTKNRYSILSVNGQGGRNVNVTVNGVDNKDNTVGGPVMQLPAEAVQEFQISTQRFSAVNGRSEGAAINVITKSGSNNYHGSAFGFFRDQALNAAQKLPDPGNTAKPYSYSTPPYSRQWFGGSIGGPIKKDKLFAFFAMEREREHTSIAEELGALTQLNLVTSLGAQPAATIPTPFFENRIAGRMDWTINSKHTAYVSVATQANNSLNDQSGGTFDLTEGNFTKNHLQIANVTLNSAFSPTLLNQFTAGWQYWNNLIDSTTRAPLFTFPSAQFGTNTNVPQESIQRKWQFKDDLSKTVGRHTFKTGFDYIWTPFMGGFFEFNPTLEIDFNDNPSCILGVAPDTTTAGCGSGTYPNGFATAGAVGSMSIAVGDPHFIIKDAKQLGLYFQDDWKMTRRLTVNLGLRWDKDYDFVGGSDIANSRTFQELQAAAPFSPLAASLVAKKASDYNKNFSPRVGFAYDLTGHGTQVLRAGYGMYYGNTFQNIPLFMEQQSNATIFQGAFAITGNDAVPGTGTPGIPLSQWRFGVDPMPTIPPPSHNLNGGTPLLPGATGRIMDPNYRNPVTEEWNGGYTWSLTSKSVIEAEYVHVLSLHENKTINVDPRIPINPANITTRTVTEDPNTGVPLCSASSCGFYRPLDAAFLAAGVPLLGSVRNDEAIGRSRYDGMNISYRQRGFHKVDLIANYTLGRAVGYDQDGGSFRYYPRDPRNPFSPNEFGPSLNDERHHATIAGTVNLPWGMAFSPILQAGSARPYLVTSSFNELNLSGGSSAGALVVLNSDPNNVLATTTMSKLAIVQCYYSGNCHVVPYNSNRGDPYFNMDVRLAKNIKLGEGRNLQLAFQGFNLFNHANYGNNFDNVVQSNTFGKAIGFINPTSSLLPRAFTAEFGARFTF
ncbi:MAG TPA: carboxypeptidase regulatory-like domain-containing protein [Rugosimonospora sp.]|nr:carboxypeptidase regulatory-like domain-containing protein [Rugosimonospora sp.]